MIVVVDDGSGIGSCGDCVAAGADGGVGDFVVRFFLFHFLSKTAGSL